VPAFHSSAGTEAIAFCESFGLFLDPWQQHVLLNSLGERRDGTWASFEVGLVVPRQSGKGSILEARELAGLFLFGEELILHSAHEFKTAAEAFRRVLLHVDGNSFLTKRVKKVRTSHGEEGIELTNGQRLRFVARSTGSGRGFTSDLAIFDEAYNLASKQMSALLPTLSARPNPQVWYTSSAGMDSSDQLRLVRKRGMDGNSARLAYFEWSCPADVDPDDRAAWAQANPALGIRIREEFVEAEREALDDEGFLRERLGVWHDLANQQIINPAVWNELIDESSEVRDPVVLGCDASPEREFASISIAGGRADNLHHVEVIRSAPGTGWVVPELKRLHKRWKPLEIALDPASAAGAWIPDLQEAGIEPELITGREMAQACGAFHEAAVEHHSFRHLNQTELNTALAGAKTRRLSDAWAWDRRTHGVNITPLVSTTLALHSWAKHGRENRGAPNLW
jgi:phage terminase large subunit-like protein